MAMPRESVLLPTIKCSQCGSQVEISMMGEHICSGASAELTPPPEMRDRFDNNSSLQSLEKPARFPPPVDIGAANRSYARQGPLTPRSHPGESPLTPVTRLTPVGTNDYFLNNAVGPGNSAPSPRGTRRPGGYGGLGDQQDDSLKPEPTPSPTTPGLMERFNTIVPGPFDIQRRPSATELVAPLRHGNHDVSSHLEQPVRPVDRPGTASSNFSGGSLDKSAASRGPRTNGYGGFGPSSRSGDELAPPPLASSYRPGTGNSNLSNGSIENTASSKAPRANGYGGFGATPGISDELAPPPLTSINRPGTGNSNLSNGSIENTASSKAPRTNGYGGFGAPSNISDDLAPPPLASLSRPGTANSNLSSSTIENPTNPKMPRSNGYGGFGPPPTGRDNHTPPPLAALGRSETFPRPSPAPGPRPDHRRQQSSFANGRGPSAGPGTARPPPPRKSLIRPPTAGDAAVNLLAEFGSSNPYHTPSDSASSGYSLSSAPSNTSTHTSPAGSQTQPQPAESAHMEELMKEVQPSIPNARPKDPRVEQKPPPRAQYPSTEPPQRLPSRGNPMGLGPQQMRRDIPPGPYERPMPPSRLDSTPRSQPQGYYNPYAPPQQGNNYNGRMGGPSPPVRGGPPPRQASLDPRSRGDCKACGLPITGKSVSSADGRLTGKYHKPCFVCATCSQPFTSAEFYVLNDKPYCAQHYHRLNGSLCGTCGRGIEGQFVEDENLTKHHVNCFRCLDCGRSLSDGYFEVDGKAYCERDAYRRQQQSMPHGPPQSTIPEESIQPAPQPVVQPMAQPTVQPVVQPVEQPVGKPTLDTATQAPQKPRQGPRLPPGAIGLPARPSPRPSQTAAAPSVAAAANGPPGPASNSIAQTPSPTPSTGSGGRGRPVYGVPPQGMRGGPGSRPGPRMAPPGAGLAPPAPRMYKRMTRLGQM